VLRFKIVFLLSLMSRGASAFLSEDVADTLLESFLHHPLFHPPLPRCSGCFCPNVVFKKRLPGWSPLPRAIHPFKEMAPSFLPSDVPTPRYFFINLPPFVVVFLEEIAKNLLFVTSASLNDED